MSDGPLFVWDATIAQNAKREYEEIYRSPKEIQAWMEKNCKKWCFQLEKGKEKGFMHYQCRFSLNTKCRMSGVIRLFEEENIYGVHLSRTSDGGKVDLRYVCKTDTRVDGPWDQSNVIKFIPVQIRNAILREWQSAGEMLLKIRNERNINILYDVIGNIGKSFFAKYMSINNYAYYIPYCNNYQDIMAMVLAKLPKWEELDDTKFYSFIFDMPRALPKNKLNEMYAAIETIKDGYAYDKRYEFKEKHFNHPNIMIFTNELPDMKMLSQDRWKIWCVKDEKLVPYKMYGEFGMLRAIGPSPVPAQITPPKETKYEMDKALDDKIEQLLEIKKLRNIEEIDLNLNNNLLNKEVLTNLKKSAELWPKLPQEKY